MHGMFLCVGEGKKWKMFNVYLICYLTLKKEKKKKK